MQLLRFILLKFCTELGSELVISIRSIPVVFPMDWVGKSYITTIIVYELEAK